MAERKTVVIVGAGVGGIAVAARLTHAGVRVIVCEKNDFTGGRCSLIRKNGHRFDQGPSLLLVPELFHETYTDLGTTFRDEGIDLVQCQPNYTIHFHDGEHFTASTDMSLMKEQLERFEGKTGFEAFLDFLKESHRHYELSLEHVLHRNFPSLLSMLRWRFLSNVIRLHPFESMYARASKHFASERLRRVFTFASMYMGMSPFDAPGTYSLLQYTEFARGIWYPIGGFHAVIDAIAKIAVRKGAIIRLSTPIKRVLRSSSASEAFANGVELESGEIIEADAVVVNADLVWAYNHLFSDDPSDGEGDNANGTKKPVTHSGDTTKMSNETERYGQQLSSRATSCSSISFFWSISKRLSPPQSHSTIPSTTSVPSTFADHDAPTTATSTQLTAHNIFLASAYRESFDSIFKYHSVPSDPSFYVNIPSLLDRSAAPDDGESVVVLVPVGALTVDDDAFEGSQSKSKRRALIERIKEQVLDTIKERTGEDWRAFIRDEIVNDPITWQEKFNLHRGAILGLSHSFFNVLSFRPKIQHPYLASCFFVGASTHPGTGVPIVLAGAKLTSEAVLEHLGVRIPWTLAAQSYEASGKVRTDLDSVNRRWKIPMWWSSFAGLLGVILALMFKVHAWH